MQHVKIAAQQFTGKIGIGMAWINQRNTIAQFIPFTDQTFQFGLTLFQQAIVFAPREQAARADNDKGTQPKQKYQRNALRYPFFRQFRIASVSPHTP